MEVLLKEPKASVLSFLPYAGMDSFLKSCNAYCAALTAHALRLHFMLRVRLAMGVQTASNLHKRESKRKLVTVANGSVII